MIKNENFIHVVILTGLISFGLPTCCFLIHEKHMEDQYCNNLKKLQETTKELTDEYWKTVLVQRDLAEYTCDPKTGKTEFVFKKK